MSARNSAVAELMWELKQADKVAPMSSVARRAGFSPGKNGKTVLSVLKAVRQDWPHLEWWRVISDDSTVEQGSEHARALQAWGAGVDGFVENSRVSVLIDESRIQTWPGDESR